MPNPMHLYSLCNHEMAVLASILALTAFAFGQTTETEWSAEAIRRYPELQVRDSPLNVLFVAEQNRLRESSPRFFDDPKWPVLLARRCFDLLAAKTRASDKPHENSSDPPTLQQQEPQASPRQSAAPTTSVAVIAPSASTRVEARSLLTHWHLQETPLREADGILVVVRSALFNPLMSSYDSIKELQDDADRQLNISGENFHIYIYEINSDLSVSQLKHTSYKADD